MRKVKLISNIVVLFIMILFISSFFALESKVPLSDLLHVLLRNLPLSLSGAVLAVIFQEWALARMRKAKDNEVT